MVSLPNLPAPQEGHVRVLRVERGDDPLAGGLYREYRSLLRHWEDLPTPYGEIRDERIEAMCPGSALVCGSLLHQFYEWFPDGTVEKMEGVVLVALDVPEYALIKGRKQVVFDRRKAVEVQVLYGQ